jgi:hypothetical protein
MLASRHFYPPDLVTATFAGVVTADDQTELVSFVRAAAGSAGSIRVMLRLDHFGGWTADARFDRETVWLRDDEGVSKIAIVGNPEWRMPVLTFVAQPLRSIPIQYFATEAAARRWLAQPSAPAPPPST